MHRFWILLTKYYGKVNTGQIKIVRAGLPKGLGTEFLDGKF
jgi:hypothetical protein